ncbi:winged helix-turn-helix domain-containing protein [Scandinavium sp. V105_16]|uniref:Winged helix-turn-helix domain-containing protein n=1 Tax=Scandinavium lactucae TaxID=3095028 RepID=A0AAJ2S8V4_9ENTR|nr:MULTISPECIES: winged helix-turn-helix domain-containing protein [unclassified Scandinavium]MDX6020133.1 winged helix-turn-helix domain-containing protein [Scandinavium sp. V105_16]MDX6032122.1 winged helix-turn-helix domain-containing protein [Scandinavium sp. V105_12]MDX6040682.1 winged helix-turn-helix domain-containing protein [Scandinavium sp. V105_6]MDX6051586.1 winged helix-turn-helix domain-containing protein [Scandinavium sp. V105_1]
MHKYIINHQCVFNEQQNELRNLSNSLVIKMTAMRANCLRFMIEHAERGIIDRQALTNELWGERGKFVNDANLTQMIYLIRKDLKAIGISDLLVTVPRRGIQVNSGIAIEKVEITHHRTPPHASVAKPGAIALGLLFVIAAFFYLI